MDIETAILADNGRAVRVLDQTALPNEEIYIDLRTPQEIYEAISRLVVRGAPAIGIAAAMGVCVCASDIAATDRGKFLRELRRIADYIVSARPTAVNLAVDVNRMLNIAQSTEGDVGKIKAALRAECEAIRCDCIRACSRIGEYGLKLLKPDFGILTHCNAGMLATARYGTATAPIYLGQERGYGFKVYCDETRPLLQGARLTAYELLNAGVDTTLICDNMAAQLMRSGRIQAVLVGSDRVAANGDAANKIGTLSAAIAANRYGIPFYVCVPTTSIDLSCATGDDIQIEQRAPQEVTELWYEKRMAPAGVKVENPAFDVTDAELITAIITEKGIAYPSYTDSLRNVYYRP